MQIAKKGTVDAAPTARTDAIEKEDVLARLLQQEARTLERLCQITGWVQADTQKTLLSLVAAGRADCKIRHGRPMYAAKGCCWPVSG